MRHLVLWSFVALLMSAVLGGSARASTHYIAASGSDTNDGASKSTPWAHAPGMANCGGTCGSYTPAPGDQFIFRGGDTWGAASFVWNWSWSGSAGNTTYIGVDQSWFTGGSWTRPIMDCQNSCNQQLSFSSITNIQVDNLEWKGLFDNSGAPSFGSIYSINAHQLGNNPNVAISNNYFHGWNILHDNTQDAIIILWSTGATDTNSRIFNNVADGSDATGNAPHVMCFVYGSPGIIYNNYAGYMSNGYINGSNSSGLGAWVRLFHDNLVEYIYSSVDGATHENMFESIGDGGTIAYNNLIRHGAFSGLVVFELAPYSGTTSYAFNNVLYDILSPNGQQCYENAPAGGNCYFFNNTSQCGAIGSSNVGCGRSTGVSTAFFINEHFITSAQPIQNPLTGSTSSNVTQTESTASSQGYTSTETFAYSPTSATSATVSTAGTNEGSLCSAVGSVNSAAGTSCQADTTYSCAYSTSNHTMSCPDRSVVQRPSSGAGAWNVGAFYFGASSVKAPNPPTGLAANVQ
jgi:hypothetical protein